MSQAKSRLRLSKEDSSPNEVDERSAAQSIENTAEPVTDASQLHQVVAELQSRLASIEKKQKTQARRIKSTANVPAANTVDQQTIASAGANLTELEEKLNELRELETRLQIEEVALHTRSRAAAQEEILLQHESQTLRLKLQSYKAMARHLREQELAIAAQTRDLKQARQQLDEDRKRIEQARNEVEQLRQSPVKSDVKTIDAKPLLQVVSAVSPVAPRSKHRTLIAASLAVLAVTALAGICIAAAWMTIKPLYRATTELSASTLPQRSMNPADHFDGAMLKESLMLLAKRGLRPFETTHDMATALSQQMTIAFQDGGEGNTASQVLFSYDSPRRDEAVLILEALSSTYLDGHQSSNIRIIRAPAADLEPIRDARMQSAMQYFAVCMTITMLLAWAWHRHASRHQI